MSENRGVPWRPRRLGLAAAAVVNMSWVYFEKSKAHKQAVQRVIDAGAVAATTRDDSRASYSNYGSCVDLFAPGSGIVSADNNSDTGSAP